MNNNEPLQDVQKQMRGLLTRLSDVPVSSNFTARVMQAIELEEMRQSRSWFFGWRWRAIVPRAAAATVIVGLAGFTFYQHEIYVQQVALARSAALVASQQMPSVEALKNFDAIQRMGQSARPDNELLALASNMQ
jgi:hypothetical protein